MPIRPLASAPEATTRLMGCPWSHMRRRNLRNKNLIRQHLYLRLSLSRRNPKKSRLSNHPTMMMRKTPLKRMS